MSTDTDRTAALARWYISGPLEPDALAAALKVARTVAVGDSNHDVWTLFDTMNEHYGLDFDAGQFAQIARTVLHALVGIGGLEVKDPVRALQLWWARNRTVTLAWALGEAISLISPEDRAQIEQARAAQRSLSGAGD
jgi:hypothetical protein